MDTTANAPQETCAIIVRAGRRVRVACFPCDENMRKLFDCKLDRDHYASKPIYACRKTIDEEN